METTGPPGVEIIGEKNKNKEKNSENIERVREKKAKTGKCKTSKAKSGRGSSEVLGPVSQQKIQPIERPSDVVSLCPKDDVISINPHDPSNCSYNLDAYPLTAAAHPTKAAQIARGMSDGDVIVIEPRNSPPLSPESPAVLPGKKQCWTV